MFIIEPVVEAAQSESTNDDCFALLDTSPAAAVWTTDQRSGRGSRGRTWLTPPDFGLALSIGLRGGLGPEPGRFCYPLFAGVLLHRCLHALCPDADFALKWPNDVLLHGRKLAGILCESRWGGDGVRIVLGMGLNLRKHHSLNDLPKPAATLSELNEPPSAAAIVGRLVAELPSLLSEISDSHRLREAWLKWAWHHPGTRIQVHADGRRVTGVFDGLSDDGGMKIRDDDGVIQVIQQSCDDFQVLGR